jgi:hypothetical protein
MGYVYFVMRDTTHLHKLLTRINDGTVKCRGEEKRIGFVKPDMPAYRRLGRKNEGNPNGDFRFPGFTL